MYYGDIGPKYLTLERQAKAVLFKSLAESVNMYTYIHTYVLGIQRVKWAVPWGSFYNCWFSCQSSKIKVWL